MGVVSTDASTQPQVRAGSVGGEWVRAHDGPYPGSLLITVELDPGTDPDVWMALMTAYRGIARELVKGDIYVHGSRVMKGMGKHSADEYVRLDDQPA